MTSSSDPSNRRAYITSPSNPPRTSEILDEVEGGIEQGVVKRQMACISYSSKIN